jgi:hypothetical protein
MPESKTLHEALNENAEEGPQEFKPKKPSPIEPPPPPPGDWITHPITRSVGFLILIAAIVFLVMKGPEWAHFLKEHSFTMGLVIFAVAMAVILLGYSYWKSIARGDRGEAYWYIEKKDRKGPS